MAVTRADSANRWPPPRPAGEAIPARPWLPDVLRKQGISEKAAALMVYLVVDEIVDDDVGLSVSRWPDADPEGRLRFDLRGGPLALGVTMNELIDYLQMPSKSGRRNGGRRKVVRIGDVFGAEPSGPLELIRLRSLQDSLGPAIDLSAEARKVAKLAFYGAATTSFSPTEARDWKLEELQA